MSKENATQYSVKILSKIGEIFEEDEEFLAELSEGNNLTDFVHALANIVPTNFYNEMTNSNVNMIDFNHLANKLCFQNSNRVDGSK